MPPVDPAGPDDVRTFLAARPPFDALPAADVVGMARAATVRHYRRGELVLDAFRRTNDALFLVRSGQVQVIDDDAPDAEGETVGPGGLFGYSALLTGRSIGPLALAAAEDTAVLRIPGALVAPVFATEPGARFLAARLADRSTRAPAAYTVVDDLIVTRPLVVGPDLPIRELAAAMTERGWSAAAIARPDGGYGLVTDRMLRARVVAVADPPATASEVMDADPPLVPIGSSAAEALIRMLDRRADAVLVTAADGRLVGMVGPGDFIVSPTTAGVSLHEQLRRADSVTGLQQLARRVPALLVDLLDRGLPSARVIAVYSAMVDTVVRQAIVLVFQGHPELSRDRFTWLALGSHGRREPVLSSDIDAAVAFDDRLTETEMTSYRFCFAEIRAVLAGAGLPADGHGATPERPAFSRPNAAWRAAGLAWMKDPAAHNGAMMTSLLVDGRPIHGDPGLPEVSRIFAELRAHRGTMRLLLAESLARRARLRSIRDLFARRDSRFDIKAHALLPIVNIARWAALSQGSTVLPTVDRLRAAAGSAILPQAQADTLIEVFEVLQRLRLRYQLGQHADAEPVADVVDKERLSAIDRSVITRAVREIAAVQKRMDNIAEYLPASEWTEPAR